MEAFIALRGGGAGAGQGVWCAARGGGCVQASAFHPPHIPSRHHHHHHHHHQPIIAHHHHPPIIIIKTRAHTTSEYRVLLGHARIADVFVDTSKIGTDALFERCTHFAPLDTSTLPGRAVL